MMQIISIFLILVSVLLAGCVSQKTSVPKATPTTLDGTNDIWNAAWHGDLKSVKRFVIAQPELVGATNRFGVTPLQYAAWAGQLSVCRCLLDHGANASEAANGTWTPLQWAVYFGQDPQVAELLLSRGADINEGRFCPPIIMAVVAGNKLMVAQLLKHHPDVNARLNNTNGFTPLMLAAFLGQEEITQMLAAHGADPNLTAAYGFTALHGSVIDKAAINSKIDELLRAAAVSQPGQTNDAYAGMLRDIKGLAPTGKDCRSIVELLLERGANINARTANGCTPLSSAALQGNITAAEVLLEHHADLELKDIAGFTPLSTAVEARKVNMVRLLLAKGADVRTRNKEQSTPLHLAAISGNGEIVALLLARHAEVNARNAGLQTPLHGAAVLGHAEAAALLLQNGANPRFMDVDLMTPLHHAAFGPAPPPNNSVQPVPKDDVAGHRAVAELLLRHGADVEARSKLGQTPLHQAARSGRTNVAVVLIAHGADVNACAYGDGNSVPLMFAAQEGRKAMVQLLLASHADLNAVDIHKRTALHLAANCHFRMPGIIPAGADYPATVNLLLIDGANPSAPDKEGRTPLHYAATGNQVAVARLMLEHQADINVVDSNNDTPLHFAVGLSHKKMVEFLLEQHPDLNIKDSNGHTALGLARWNNDNEIVQLLVSHGAK